MITIVRYPKILDPTKHTRWTSYPGSKLRKYLPFEFHGIVEVDGQRIESEKWDEFMPSDNSKIDVMDLPGEGVSIAAVIILLVLAAGSVVASILLAPKPPSFRTGKNKEETEEPSFTGIQTTTGTGRPISFILGGPVRVGGHIIESFTDPNFDAIPASEGDVVTVTENEAQLPNSRRLNTRIAWGWGPLKSLTSIEIDDNPIVNIKGVMHETVLGTVMQSRLIGFNEAKTNVDVSELIAFGSPFIKQTISEVDTVEVFIQFAGGLFQINSKGKLKTLEVDVKFEYKVPSAGSYTLFKQVTISGDKTSPLNFVARFPILVRGIYDIRVTRITADRTQDINNQDQFTWDRMNEVLAGSTTDDGRSHPGIAQTGFRQIPQEQTSVPRKYSALVEGLDDCRLYSDLTTFTVGFSNNPAWCFLRWVTSGEFGPGAFYTYEDNIDIQSFIDWADYCDDFVDNGKGGNERRCVFGYEFKTGFDAQSIIEIFQNAGEAAIVEEGGKWRAVPIEVKTKVALYTEGNYEKGSFKHKLVDTSIRPSRVTGNFQNEQRDFDTSSISRVDPILADDNHFVESEFNFWGVTRPSEVVRKMDRIINFNRLSDAVVEFNAGISGLARKAGDLIDVSTTTASIGIAAGRLIRVSPNQVKIHIDNKVTLDPAKNYEIVVQHQDDDISISTLALVNVINTEVNLIEVQNPTWKAVPLPGDVYSLGEKNKVIEQFVIEKTTLDQKLRRRIIASKYDVDIFKIDFKQEDDPTRNTILNPGLMPSPVRNLGLKARQIKDSNSDTDDVIDAGWEPSDADEDVFCYEIFFRESGSPNWRFAGMSCDATHTITEPGVTNNTTYNVVVRGVSSENRKPALEDSTQATITTLA